MVSEVEKDANAFSNFEQVKCLSFDKIKTENDACFAESPFAKDN